MPRPRNWPDRLPYLESPLHSKEITPEQKKVLRQRPDGSSSTPIIETSATSTPCDKVKIQAIKDSSHPANGQYGLFASQNISPGDFILAYLGKVHSGALAASDPNSVSAKSDYDLWLDRDADAAVDAANEGNEGRFVNDYRGIGQRANAEFRPVFCERWGELCVGVWALGGGKKRIDKSKGIGGIKKGEEILVSYGKGFWDERKREQDEQEGT